MDERKKELDRTHSLMHAHRCSICQAGGTCLKASALKRSYEAAQANFAPSLAPQISEPIQAPKNPRRAKPEKLTPEQRSEISKAAAAKRWAKV